MNLDNYGTVDCSFEYTSTPPIISESGVQTFNMNREALMQQFEDIRLRSEKQLSSSLYISRTGYRESTGKPCPDNFEMKTKRRTGNLTEKE